MQIQIYEHDIHSLGGTQGSLENTYFQNTQISTRRQRLFAQDNLNTVTAACANAGVDQTAGDTKEVWTNLLSALKKSGSNRWWLMKA